MAEYTFTYFTRLRATIKEPYPAQDGESVGKLQRNESPFWQLSEMRFHLPPHDKESHGYTTVDQSASRLVVYMYSQKEPQRWVGLRRRQTEERYESSVNLKHAQPADQVKIRYWFRDVHN